jgi:tripartite-type tricarboxylate transporter receptor subunit TctC
MGRNLVSYALGCVAIALSLGHAAAQDAYPSKPIKLIVPLAAGGGIDFTARTTAQKLSDVLGQQVVVENQGGAGGTLGVNAVARAAPDGYTLLYHSVTGVVSSVVGKDLPYDWLRDLAPVSLVTRFAPVLIINPSLPAKDLKEFIALAKANPGKFSYGSSGAGTAIHLASDLFTSTAGVDIVHVPYRGGGPSINDLVAGQVQMTFEGAGVLIPLIHTGKLKALATTSPNRIAELPDVPTMAESGFPGFVSRSWTGLLAPARTPRDIIDKLNTQINEGLKSQELRAALAKLSNEPLGGTPQAFTDVIKGDIAKWGPVVKALGLQAP